MRITVDLELDLPTIQAIVADADREERDIPSTIVDLIHAGLNAWDIDDALAVEIEQRSIVDGMPPLTSHLSPPLAEDSSAHVPS